MALIIRWAKSAYLYTVIIICLAVFMQIACYSWGTSSLLRLFPSLGSTHQVFILHILCSFLSLYSCLLHILLYNITPPQFQCHDTYIFPLLHLPMSFSPHTCPNHPSRFSYFLTYVCHTYSYLFCPDRLDLLYIPIIHLNMIISVRSNNLSSLCEQVTMRFRKPHPLVSSLY